MDTKIISIAGLAKWVKDNNAVLSIPDLQRSYVWREKEWERLWVDILDVYFKWEEENEEQPAQHFIGVITLKQTDCSGEYEIIDGQQRLTTVSILLDYLYDCSNIGNRDKINVSGIGFDIAGLHVCQHFDAVSEDNTGKNGKNGTSSDKKLSPEELYIKAYNFFAGKFAESAGDINAAELGEVIKKRLFLLPDIAKDGAGDAFERLNATGEPLAYTDLILNYLIELDANKEPSEVRERWEKIINSIYDGELPPSDDEDDGEEESADGNSEELPPQEDENSIENPDGESDDEKSKKSATSVKPLKLKKFFNALHCLTLPNRVSFPETVDDFERVFRRLNLSEPQSGNFDIDYIFGELERWSVYYLNYLDPTNCSGKEYARYLYYLKTIGSSHLIPAAMRVLDRVKKQTLTDGQAADIFRAMVSAQIISSVYTERENSADTDNKLRAADYIYMALMEQEMHSYNNLLCCLAGSEKIAEVCRLNEEDKKEALFRLPYRSGMSKAILAIDYDGNNAEKGYLYQIEDTNNPFQVEHMVALNLQVDYAEYGYDDLSVNDFHNLNLLEASLNKEASNKSPEDKQATWASSEMKSKYIFKKDSKQTMKDSQQYRLDKLFAAVMKFMFTDFRYAENSGRMSPLGLVSYLRDNVRYIGTCDYTEKEKQSDTLHIARLEDGKYKLGFDKTGKNEIVDCWFKNTQQEKSSQRFIKIIEQAPDDGELKSKRVKRVALLQFVETTLNELTKVYGNNADVILYKLLYDCQKDDSNNWKAANNVLFFSEDNPRKSRTKFSEKNAVELNNGTLILYCNSDNNPIDTTEALCFIYQKLNEKYQIKFGIWLEMAHGEAHFIKGLRTLTPYRNIGDRDMYEDFVAKKNELPQIAPASQGYRDVIKEVVEPFIKAEYTTYGKLNNKMKLNKMKFTVPEYQRAYVWTKQQWDALVESIDNVSPLGTIVLYDKQDGEYAIVDGQQRLTTLAALTGTHSELTDREQANDVTNHFQNTDNKCSGDPYSAMLTVLYINSHDPKTQYRVFGTINGCGKPLSLNDKVRNHLIGKFPEKVEDINIIAELDGFVKAYTEMKCAEAIPARELYDEFKEKIKDERFSKLYGFAKIYGLIKGYNNPWGLLNINIKDGIITDDDETHTKRSLVLWMKLYQLLDVNTGDSLLLYAFTLWKKDLKKLTDFMRDLIMLYFLLYVDDPGGNNKKSINSKLPKLIKIDPRNPRDPHDALKAEFKKGSLALGESFFNPGTKPADYVFEKLRSTDLARSTRKCVARFILMLCELWCGLDVEKALKLLGAKEDNQGEIEHIFPANPNNLPKNFERPVPLYTLQNVCLLEGKINRKISNGMLKDKLNGVEGRRYSSSEYIMPRMFDKNGWNWYVFGQEQADKRMEYLQKLILKKDGLFVRMLNSLLENASQALQTNQ